jgi:SAM-dependent methyltransferase
MTQHYGEDLAFIHDAGFGHLARGAAETLSRALRERGIAAGLVVDLGCGSGLTAEALVAAGFDVLGIDISPDMVALARRRVPAARFETGSFLDASLPPCVAVTAIGEVVNYLFDQSNEFSALRPLLGRIFAALAPGGVLLLDFSEPGRAPGGSARVWTEGDGWAVLMAAEEDREQRRLTRAITTFRRVGELYRRDHETHRLQLVPRAEVLAELGAAGFDAEVLDSYSAVRLPAAHTGVLAHKPGATR